MVLTMGNPFFTNFIFVALSSFLGAGFAYSQAKDDLVMVLDGKQYSIAYYKSSIKSLPPDWKKVWIITNRKTDQGQAQSQYLLHFGVHQLCGTQCDRKTGTANRYRFQLK
jgi:hypothetical protein